MLYILLLTLLLPLTTLANSMEGFVGSWELNTKHCDKSAFYNAKNESIEYVQSCRYRFSFDDSINCFDSAVTYHLSSRKISQKLGCVYSKKGELIFWEGKYGQRDDQGKNFRVVLKGHKIDLREDANNEKKVELYGDFGLLLFTSMQ